MKKASKSPAELRSMFGANLRQLSNAYPSISDLSRQLGINRTQYNRYLSGESFPRPDVLARICAFFEVDARVLLEPVSDITDSKGPLGSSFLHDFVYAGATGITPEVFPSGFYRFSRRSFTLEDVFIIGLVYVFRQDNSSYLRGYESKTAMELQGLPTQPQAREFRGIIMQQEDGIVILISRKNAMTSSFNYLSRVASFENNFWVGYSTRTVPENTGGLRVTRTVFEFLGERPGDALPAARKIGFQKTEDLLPFHRRLLQPDIPFS